MRFASESSSSVKSQLLSMEYYVGAGACDRVCNGNARWVCRLGVSIAEMILQKVLIYEGRLKSVPEPPVYTYGSIMVGHIPTFIIQ